MCPHAYWIVGQWREDGRGTERPGAQVNGGRFDPVVSADGRYVAFDSEASNPVPGATNAAGDLFRIAAP